MAACMKEAILKCQEFKRAKKPKGQGVKRVKLTAEEKARRKEERRMAFSSAVSFTLFTP